MDLIRPYSDPYDLWETNAGVAARKAYYKGKIRGLCGAAMIGALDWLFPALSRRVAGSARRIHPITAAQLCLATHGAGAEDRASEWLQIFRDIAAVAHDGEWSWGLGFPWMSKNGLYQADVPFITHTPYVMEALLHVAAYSPRQDAQVCGKMFNDTWRFLRRLRVMYDHGGCMAVSYSPEKEPRIVINAVAYAAWAYAMHYLQGLDERKKVARNILEKLCRWVVSQQNGNGSWYYYADKSSGNFIDCFHSCFVVKNLRKVMGAVPELTSLLHTSIDCGAKYIESTFYDEKLGLCKRFSERDIKDAFLWDLYDQAEFLGLLIDEGRYTEAFGFQRAVVRQFAKEADWYCRIDRLNRRWGKNFLRWGIVPWWYQESRLSGVTARV